MGHIPLSYKNFDLGASKLNHINIHYYYYYYYYWAVI